MLLGPCVVTSASLLSHSSSRVVEVLDTSRRFLGASISEKNDKADNVGDTETNSQGLWTSKHQPFMHHQMDTGSGHKLMNVADLHFTVHQL